MILHRVRLPVDAAKAARVGESDRPAVVEHEVHVVVLGRCCVHGHDGQVARHAEMHDQGTALQRQQKVLGAAPDSTNSLTPDVVWNRHRPAHRRVADDHLLQAPSRNRRVEPTPSGFDFGKFRQKNPLEGCNA